MQRFGQVLRLRPGAEEAYERHHAAVWPDVLAVLHRVGIVNYSIYRYERWLFAYYEMAEGASITAAAECIATDEVCRRWEALMQTLQEPLPESGAGGWWVPMKEVFHVE